MYCSSLPKLSNDCFKVKVDGMYGYMDMNGVELVPCTHRTEASLDAEFNQKKLLIQPVIGRGAFDDNEYI